MDAINQSFQTITAAKKFPMKAIEEADKWVYKGKLALNDAHVVNFAVSITKGEKRAVAQIVYQDIAYSRSSDSRLEWLELINDLNREMGVYYYFCMDEEDTLFMRYISEVTTDFEAFFNILIQGPSLIQHTLPKIEKKFGTFVSF